MRERICGCRRLRARCTLGDAIGEAFRHGLIRGEPGFGAHKRPNLVNGFSGSLGISFRVGFRDGVQPLRVPAYFLGIAADPLQVCVVHHQQPETAHDVYVTRHPDQRSGGRHDPLQKPS